MVTTYIVHIHGFRSSLFREMIFFFLPEHVDDLKLSHASRYLFVFFIKFVRSLVACDLFSMILVSLHWLMLPRTDYPTHYLVQMFEILHYVLFCCNYYIFYFLKVFFFYFGNIALLCGFENVIFLFIFIIFYIFAYDFHELNQCDVFIYLLYFLVDQWLLWILCYKKVLVV